MIQLGTESKKFGFTVSQDKFSGVLSNIKNLAGSEGSFFVCALAKELWLVGTSSSFIGALKIDAEEVVGEGQFGFSVELIQGVTKGRATVAFNFTGSECEFKALKSKYSGKIVTIPITKEQASTVNDAFNEKAKSIKLSADILIAISNGIQSTRLTDMSTKQQCNSLINIGQNKITISSLDDYHMMLYQAKVPCDEAVKFSINPQTMGLIEKAISGKFQLSVKKEIIKFSNKNFIIIVPTVQAEDEKYDVAETYIKAMKPGKFSATVPIKTLHDTCMNLDTIHTANSQFDLELTAKGLNVRFVTESGSASDVIVSENPQGNGMCSLNPKAFMDMLNGVKQHGGEVLTVSEHGPVCGVTTKYRGVKLTGMCVVTQENTTPEKKEKKNKKTDDKHSDEATKSKKKGK